MLPIQEDETALVLCAIGQHYALHRDIEAIRSLYSPFVPEAADFLLSFRDERTGLPLPSYDLWEERRGVFTYTTATVTAGLRAAAKLAALFHEDQRAEAYARAAAEIKAAMQRHLYCAGENRYARGILFEEGVQRRDPTLDASLLGLVLFGGCDPWDEKIAQTLRAVEEGLWLKAGIGGMARYEGDAYQLAAGAAGIPGNPWVVCTLWLAQYRIARALDFPSLLGVVPLLEWVARRARASGVLPEQVHPYTGQYLSVSPLTWSHATFVAAVLDFIEKADMLSRTQSRPAHPARAAQPAVVENAAGAAP